MSQNPLSGAERRRLRTLGQTIRPTVHVGHEGPGVPVYRKLDEELAAHELVKVRVLPTGEASAKDIARPLAEATSATIVQVIGHTVLLYREWPDEADGEVEAP